MGDSGGGAKRGTETRHLLIWRGADGMPRRTSAFCLSAAISFLCALGCSNPALAQQATGGEGGGGTTGDGGTGGNAGAIGGGVGGGSAGTAGTPDGGMGDSSNFGGGGGGGGFSFTFGGDIVTSSQGGFGGSGGTGTGISDGGGGGIGGGGGGGGGGGDGARISAPSAVTVSATVTGGAGGSGGVSMYGGNGSGGGGGAGVVMQTANGLTVNAAVTGGSGGGSAPFSLGGGGGGGAGVILQSGGTLSVNAAITGGAGGAGGEQAGGNGGSGVIANALTNITVSATGSITGGNGSGVGSGGAGLVLSGGGSLVNAGSISGGNGGGFSGGPFPAGAGGTGSGGAPGFNPNTALPGVGGAGIIGANLTIINSGAITGYPSGFFQAGAITFTGGSNILELQAGSDISGNVVGTGADTLRFGGAANASFDVGSIGGSAQYQGFSTFIKTGTSTWTLTGTTSATGAWSINQGTLEVDGSIASASSLAVNSGGTLTGTGIVGNTQINSGGIFAPGAAGQPGTSMTIAGNLAFQSGAIYLVQLNPANATLANVTAGGTATLNGTVDASFANGGYVAKQYDILHAATLSGTFGTLQTLNLPAGFTASLSYANTDVFLDLTAVIGHTVQTGGLNQNQQNIANALNGFFNNGGTLTPGFLNVFGLTGASLQNALTQLSGEDATGSQKGAFQFMSEYLSLMLDPFVAGRGGSAAGGATPFAPEQQASFPPDIALAYDAILKAPPKQSFEQRWTAWGAGFGGYNKTNGDPTVGSNTVTAHDSGFAAGMDYHFSPDTLAGFSLAGGGTNWGLAQALGGGRSDAFSGGVYAKTHSGPWYLAGALAAADHWFDTNRIAAFGDQLTARFNGQSFGGRVEAGYRYAVQPMIGIAPYAALQAQGFHTPRYSETDVTAGGFGLTYNAMSASDTRGELGARFDDLTMLGAMPLVLRSRLAWAHDWVSNPALGAAFQTLPGASFIVNGAAPPKDSALATAAAELHMTVNWSLAAKFDGEFARGSQTYAGTGTLRYAW
jgi:uncharacterized protein with beta-barrel porin domain